MPQKSDRPSAVTKRARAIDPVSVLPAGTHIEAGGYVGGDSHEYCWLIFERGYVGAPELGWLFRDKFATPKGERQ
jgi:hypothetical protein